MADFEQLVKNENALALVALSLSEYLKAPFILYLKGDLGAGKSTLVRHLLNAFGYTETVKSPSYSLIEPYFFNSFQIFHLDLYRLNDPEELEFIGLRDYCHDQSILLIEWPEKGGEAIPNADMICQISFTSDCHERSISWQSLTQTGEVCLHAIKSKFSHSS